MSNYYNATLFLYFFCRELETIKLVTKRLSEKTEVEVRESGVGYSVPVLKSPMYAKPNLSIDVDADKTTNVQS